MFSMKSHNLPNTEHKYDNRTSLCAVSHATLKQPRRFDVVSLFINNIFVMIILALRQDGCTPGQPVNLSLGILLSGV